VYTPDLQETDRIDLPVDPKNSRGSWKLLVPPAGNVIFLEHWLNGSRSLQMLSSSPLQEVRYWEKSEDLSSASDRYFAKWGENRRLYVRAFDTPWRALVDLGPRRRGGCGYANARFVNQDSLIVDVCDSVQLIGVDGQILFTAHVPKGRLARGAWGSPDGRFVAVATTTMRGRRIALAFDVSAGPAPRRILVYDTKSSSLVASMKYTWTHACAFSPDGSALAVLSGGIIKMFELPQPSR
jgi:hypothetical protein